MGFSRNGDGEIVFDVDYFNVWHQPSNLQYMLQLRSALATGEAVNVVFQPGDGTRYSFLLFRQPDEHDISRERGPRMSAGDPNVLYATILNGLGAGTGVFNRQYSDGSVESIRHRIDDKMDVKNPCTREALAATVMALWS